MESNNDNPLIYNLLKKKGKLYLLDKFKLLGKNNKLQQEKTANEQIKEETAEDKEKPVQDNINKDTPEQNNELDKSDQVDTKVETETELEQELMNIIAQASQDEAWYNTLIGPSTINGIKENKYSAWEGTGEIVSPQTGDLTLKINDITLPGRNGLDINLGRIYQSNQALLGDYRLSVFDNYHNDFSTYYQNRYNLGAGWAFTFPSVQVEQDVIYMGSDQTELYYHTGNGDIYHVNFTPDPNDSNLEDYYKKDGVFMAYLKKILVFPTRMGQEAVSRNLLYPNTSLKQRTKQNNTLQKTDGLWPLWIVLTIKLSLNTTCFR